MKITTSDLKKDRQWSAAIGKRNQKIGLDILEKALDQLKATPERKLLTVEDFRRLLEEEKEIILDVTEQRIQRPSDPELQRETYFGKKKATH